MLKCLEMWDAAVRHLNTVAEEDSSEKRFASESRFWLRWFWVHTNHSVSWICRPSILRSSWRPWLNKRGTTLTLLIYGRNVMMKLLAASVKFCEACFLQMYSKEGKWCERKEWAVCRRTWSVEKNSASCAISSKERGRRRRNENVFAVRCTIFGVINNAGESYAYITLEEIVTVDYNVAFSELMICSKYKKWGLNLWKADFLEISVNIGR